MATATTKTTTEIPDFAEKIRERLLSTVRQGQQLSVDAAQTWVKAVSVLPVHHLSDLPTVPGVPALPRVEAATKFSCRPRRRPAQCSARLCLEAGQRPRHRKAGLNRIPVRDDGGHGRADGSR